MKARNVGYWVATATVAFAFGVGGAFDLSGSPEVVAALGRRERDRLLASLSLPPTTQR